MDVTGITGDEGADADDYSRANCYQNSDNWCELRLQTTGAQPCLAVLRHIFMKSQGFAVLQRKCLEDGNITDIFRCHACNLPRCLRCALSRLFDAGRIAKNHQDERGENHEGKYREFPVDEKHYC